MSIDPNVMASLDIAEQYLALAGNVAAAAYPDSKAGTYAQFAASLVALASHAITNQVDLPDLATISARELQILADDASAQQAALSKGAAG